MYVISDFENADGYTWKVNLQKLSLPYGQKRYEIT